MALDGEKFSDENGSSSRTGPLAGLVVADFSRVLAGPYCTMLLADMGAEVIKVESLRGDDTRSWMPPTRDEISTYYLSINRNKKSITLDLGDEEELSLAKELVRRSDVMVENFKPGGLLKFGLDFESVNQFNPGLIYASISGFGTSEAASPIPGYDLMVQAISGLMSLTGDAEGPAYRAGVAVFDVMTGLHATIGILAALANRYVTKEGQHIEVSLLASAMSGLVNQTAAFVTGGVIPWRMGNAHPSLFPYEPLPTGDGDLIVIAGNDGQFKKLAEVLGIAQVASDERFARNQERTANRELLRPLLLEQLAKKSAQEWFDIFIAAGIPCAPINNIQQGVEFAKGIGIEPTITLKDGEKDFDVVRNPITFSGTPPSYRLIPPRLGEHNDEIKDWLRS